MSLQYEICAACGEPGAIPTVASPGAVCFSCALAGWKPCAWCGAVVAPPGTRTNEAHGAAPRWRCARGHKHAVCAACVGPTVCPDSDEAKVMKAVMA